LKNGASFTITSDRILRSATVRRLKRASNGGKIRLLEPEDSLSEWRQISSRSVALVDEEWTTVGSSNLDPLSLSLNLEANVIIRDRGFNRVLSESLERLMAHSCKRIEVCDLKESSA
jgi:hypothetical protein